MFVLSKLCTSIKKLEDVSNIINLCQDLRFLISIYDNLYIATYGDYIDKVLPVYCRHSEKCKKEISVNYILTQAYAYL